MRFRSVLIAGYYVVSNVINRINFLFRRVSVGEGLQSKGILLVRSKGMVVIGNDFRVNSSPKSNPIGGSERTSLQVLKGGVLKISDNVGISNVSITCACKIEIGSGVRIGGGAAIFDTDFHSLDSYERVNRRYGVSENVKVASVVIKDNAFIGARVIILKGSYVGENSIVGAGSVVSGKIPDNQIWAGNPAKFIRNISSPYSPNNQ